MKYLETLTTYFVSPHGEYDEGGTTKQVVGGKEYDQQYKEQQLPENENNYYEDGEWIDSEYYTGSEDGYNQIFESSTLKPLSDEEAKEAKEIIKAYKKL